MPGNVNFYLKKKEKSTGKSLIYLKFKYSGNVFVYTFDQTIAPGNWNSAKQRVKSNKQTTKDGEHSLNDLLDNLEEVLLTTYRSEIANGIPAKSVLKEALDKFNDQNSKDPSKPTFYKLLFRFISGEIKHQGREKSPNTIKTYNTLKGHLELFEAQKKYPIDYNTINLDFLYKYITFLRAEGLGQNAIAKDIQILKTILKKAVTLNESKNTWYQHEDFAVTRQETDAVYLTDKEILKLYRHKFNDKRIEGIRDLFIFGSYVGLRYSDYSTVRPENIVEIENDEGNHEKFIKMITAKTKDLVIIPCNPIVLEIFKKYSHNKNQLPFALTNQAFNREIKKLSKDAGFTEKGRLSTDPQLELWECISSHTCRRSFATNLYLEGFPVLDLMKITGHRTEKAFMRYIKVTKLDAAKRLNTHIQKQWSAKLLKIA
jgi:integrase